MNTADPLDLSTATGYPLVERTRTLGLTAGSPEDKDRWGTIMASGGFPFPNRHRADSALLIYLDAMQGYVASILERAHGQGWARSQLLTEKLKKRDLAEYERRRLALDADKEAQHLIDFPVLSQLIDDNRKSFAAWRNDDFNRVESIRDLRNELSHPDSPRECSPDLTSAIVMNCTRALRRCGLYDAVKDIEDLPPATPVTADATPDIDQREEQEHEDWLNDLSVDRMSTPEGLGLGEYLGLLWDKEWKRRGQERAEIAGFGDDIDGLREWFDADAERGSRHAPERTELRLREEQRLEKERSEIAELHKKLREWFDADEGRPQRHELEYSALIQRQLAQYEQQRPEREQGQRAELENNPPTQLQRSADELEQEPAKLAESGQADRAEQTALIRTALERGSLTKRRSSLVSTRLGAGRHHSIALREDGTVVCWGNNSSGQCDAPKGKFVAVSAGSSHSAALREDGTVVCWGNNSSGQCDAPKGKFVAVSAGSRHSAALREDGTVICWGDNSGGQCNAPKGEFVAVSAGAAHGVALHEDGTVVCWGNNSSGQCDAPKGKFVAVSAGSRHSAALREDGTVICWGDNSGGQCNAPKGEFVAVSAGAAHGVALRKNSTIVCWGSKGSGQLKAPKGEFIAVSAGRSHNIALRKDGTVVCWGHNSHGQLNAPSERL